MKVHALTLAAVFPRVAALPRVTVALAIASALPAARADNALRPDRIPTKARELADKGRKHHVAGDYDAAVSAFKEAYVLAPSTSLLFNIAQSYRLAGNCDESAWMYRRFLDTDPPGPQRDLAQNHLAVVEKCGSGGLRVAVMPTALEAATPRPEAPSLSVTSSPIGNKLERAGVYTAVGGGVALIGAALFAIDAHSASQSVEESYKRGGKWEEIAPIDSRGQRSATVATVLGVGGGVAMLSAAVLYGLGKHYETSAPPVAITPTKNGAHVNLSWGF